jgi:RNA-binding protein NOB1
MGLQVHLKKNFQYKNRGTIYSLPTPKYSSASAMKAPSRGGQPRGAVPILREDQLEWQRAVAKDKIRREKAEKQMQKAIEKSGGKKDALSARYDDPDWMPDAILTADKGRRAAGGLPAIGAGRKNPNEKQRPRG